MAKEPTQIDGASLSDMVYRQAIERIEALMGATEGSPEEQERSSGPRSPTGTNSRFQVASTRLGAK